MASREPASKPQCTDALHELYHLLAGELDDTKRAEIATHLDECPPCAEPYDFYAEVRRCVQERCHDQAPPDLLARIEQAIQHEPH
ncbi:MAG: mycothiol system anti-sigma-R factor [Acidimicrobiales bacterium]|nr:mycothiol system anti-sigma-R factor [Acidimicrobiales bacterium]